jgi:hypothetical protein
MFCDQQRRLHRGGTPIGQHCRRFASPAARALTCVRELTGADTTRCIPGIFSTWFVDWSLVTGNTMPPRDSDDDDGDEEEEEEEEEEDHEPAVIREPDE